jgi:hypothetical protein
MKGNGALQIIFGFFLGLVVVAFVGIGVNTFYPEPVFTGDYNAAANSNWRLITGIILLVLATVILVISLALPAHQAVITNGLLLGGVFTMIYAVGITVSTDQSIWRFVVVAIALAVTIVIGYLKFAKPRRGVAATVAEPAADAELAARLDRLERRLDAVRHALED